MIQPARVLPSNAPPLADTEGSHTRGVSRVLQEHSGNCQQSSYELVNDVEQKYPVGLLVENSYGGHQRPPSIQVCPPGLHPRRNYSRVPSRHFNYEERERKEKLAKLLYHRFQKSDQYVKYRLRQSKDTKGDEDAKWPDRIEMAFFQALVEWPPMGRRQFLLKEKQRGRNELISDYIEELTGEIRTRKQVSSHIQVLKPFVENDPFIMKWLSKEDFGHANGSTRGHGAYASSHANSRRMSSRPSTAMPYPGTNPQSVPAFSSYEFSRVKGLIDVFKPVDFSMFVQRKNAVNDGVDLLHTYTQSITQPLQPDEQIPDWHTFNQDFLHLANMHAHRPLNCNVIIAEASLAFPLENWKDKEGIELGISFLCSTRRLPANALVMCQNTFHRNGQLLTEQSTTNPVPLAASEDGRKVETQVKFGSTFWARTLAQLANRLTLNSAAHMDKDPRDEVSAHIQGLNATQELFLMTDHGHERLLVIFWKFRLSTSARGRASWFRILLPPNPAASTSASDYTVTSATSPHKMDRQDSVYDYTYPNPLAFPLPQDSTQPALQSPFEYDSSSSASALSSATWPSLESTVDFPGSLADDAFDFAGGNINISYGGSAGVNQTPLDFSNFDSSAFSFEGVDADANYVADPVLPPNLEDYNVAWYADQAYGPQSAQESFPQDQGFTPAIRDGVDCQVPENYTAGGSAAETEQQHGVFGTFEPSQHPGDAFDQSFSIGQDVAQAFGGAGQEVVGHGDARDGDNVPNSLAAFADANYLASSLGAPNEQTH